MQHGRCMLEVKDDGHSLGYPGSGQCRKIDAVGGMPPVWARGWYRVRPMSALLRQAPLWASLALLAACASGASYPDGSQVTAAQAGWCQALAKLNGHPNDWDSMSSCKGAYPTASAAYL